MAACSVIPVALLGLGTVGGGVYELFQRQKDEFFPKAGALPMITRILVRDLKKARPGVDPSLLTDRWEDIIGDPEIRIVIEVTGGIEPARTRILEALRAGKSVVTANKDLMAEHGAELFAAAAESECDLLFEASVAGGIPIIRPLKQCLAGNRITEVMGIVNGTTNYSLTRMSRDGMDFSDALHKAQELGYAEADPTADVEGTDAARKLAILASIAFHSRVVLGDVHAEGISRITARDIAYARELGCCVKLLAVARSDGESVEARVHPMLIPAEHPLATVSDAFNAVFVHGDAVDDAMFLGRGAGALPTASAVLGDVVDIVRNPGRKQPVDWSAEPADLTDPDAFEASFFLRTKLDKAACEQALGEIRWLPDQNGFHGGFTGKTCRKAIAAAGLALDAVWPVLE